MMICKNRSAAVIGERHELPHQIEGFRWIGAGNQIHNSAALRFEIFNQHLSILPIDKSSENLESTAPKKGKTKPSAPSRRKPPSGGANPKKPAPRPVVSKATQIAAAKTPVKSEDQTRERITKQERMLTLLSQPDGASIHEMMQATNWLQHSVRGFLAGTVKKKLGFALTSLKPEDGVRRYHIETRRGR
jgi:Protein of unknown function (DUF3489)